MHFPVCLENTLGIHLASGRSIFAGRFFRFQGEQTQPGGPTPLDTQGGIPWGDSRAPGFPSAWARGEDAELVPGQLLPVVRDLCGPARAEILLCFLGEPSGPSLRGVCSGQASE